MSGIDYPLTKEKVVNYARQKKVVETEFMENELLKIVQSLPSRTYRDSAEITKALGEVKNNRRGINSKINEMEEGEKGEQPSKKGGKVAVESSISASAIAQSLSGIDFPKSKYEIQAYVKKSSMVRMDKKRNEQIVNVLDKIKLKNYHNMAEIEREVGKVL